MAKLITKKNIYLLGLFVICLLGIVIVPTYAKFGSSYETTDDVVGLSLNFNLSITNIEEYQQLVIPAGGSESFNVEVTNNTGAIAYFGIWYRMVYPTSLSSDIEIGKLVGSTVTTSGSIDNGGVVTVPIVIINNSNSKITIDIGVASSETSTSDIEYLGGKYLITGELELPRDIMIDSITIDGEDSSSIPTSGTYTMTSSCTKGSTLTWNTINKNITYGAGTKIGDKCSLEFTTDDDYDYQLLSEMPVGSYVDYTGIGGTVGSTSVACQTNGSASSSTETDETEAPNSCSGQNAREDLDDSGYTYGYCFSSFFKYYTTGWRLAYVDSNNKPVIVSAGSPECNTRDATTNGNALYIKQANALALKYCNSNLVDNGCTCTSTTSGQCDTPSSDAWAINDTDFYYMTKTISGVGKRLADESSELGDDAGTLDSLYCSGNYSYKECGYNNDLIDNGGFYWFAAYDSSSGTSGVRWSPNFRTVFYDATAWAYGLRPVISLSSSIYVTGGSGTMNDPYTIKKIVN